MTWATAQARLNAAVLSEFGESVIFAGPTTITAIYERSNGSVPVGNARPGVPQDSLRVLDSDIADLAPGQGDTVTVRGESFVIISIEPGVNGMTRLVIRQAS